MGNMKNNQEIVATMKGVREYMEGAPVFLARHEGRLVIRATNEGGNNYTNVDLMDLVKWLKDGGYGSWLSRWNY